MIAWAVLAVCLVQSFSDAPKGYVRVSKDDRRLQKSLGPSHYASIVEGKLLIENSAQRAERLALTEEDRKRPVIAKLKLGVMTITRVEDGGLDVGDGWLIAIDGGEFGGGILWFAKDHSRSEIVSKRNTQFVGKASGSIFAFMNADPSDFDLEYSQLVEVEGQAGNWNLRPVGERFHTTRAIIQHGDRFLLGMTDHLAIMETDGTKRGIYNFGLRVYPNSLAKTVDGDLWIGFYSGVLRLRPNKHSSYDDAWFAPQNESK